MENKKLEIKRKIFHVIGGLLLILLIYLNILTQNILAIILVFTLIASFLFKKYKLPVINLFLEHFERDINKKNFPARGVFTFFTGALLLLILFEKNIVLASLAILTIGDAVSSVSSLYFKKKKNRKTFYGTILAMAFSFLGALMFVDYKLALPAAIIGMLVESVELKVYRNIVIDDNITVPLAAGFVIYLSGLIL